MTYCCTLHPRSPLGPLVNSSKNATPSRSCLSKPVQIRNQDKTQTNFLLPRVTLKPTRVRLTRPTHRSARAKGGRLETSLLSKSLQQSLQISSAEYTCASYLIVDHTLCTLNADMHTRSADKPAKQKNTLGYTALRTKDFLGMPHQRTTPNTINYTHRSMKPKQTN